MFVFRFYFSGRQRRWWRQRCSVPSLAFETRNSSVSTRALDFTLPLCFLSAGGLLAGGVWGVWPFRVSAGRIDAISRAFSSCNFGLGFPDLICLIRDLTQRFFCCRGVCGGPIDGIMGKLSMESRAASGMNPVLSSSGTDNYLRSLMVLGLGFQRSRTTIKQALKRHDDDSEWWTCPAIPLKDITAAPPPSLALPPPAEKTKKKKSKKKSLKDIAVGECRKCEEEVPESANGDAGILSLPKTGLGLSLNTEEVLKAWYDRGSVFGDSSIPDSSSTDGLAKLSEIELFLENGPAGVSREGGIEKMRHKQKQCTPLLANKSRYQARKVNAECRPRVKGRFVSQASLLKKAAEKGS